MHSEWVREAKPTFERVHDADVHDGADVGEVALRDPEVERAEGFARHNPRPVLQVSKPKEQHISHGGR